MIDRAFEWAKKNSTPTNKRFRTNEVHGEDEIKIVVNDTFEFDNIDLDETTRSGSVTVEEGDALIYCPVTLNLFSLLCQFSPCPGLRPYSSGERAACSRCRWCCPWGKGWWGARHVQVHELQVSWHVDMDLKWYKGIAVWVLSQSWVTLVTISKPKVAIPDHHCQCQSRLSSATICWCLGA